MKLEVFCFSSLHLWNLYFQSTNLPSTLHVCTPSPPHLPELSAMHRSTISQSGNLDTYDIMPERQCIHALTEVISHCLTSFLLTCGQMGGSGAVLQCSVTLTCLTTGCINPITFKQQVSTQYTTTCELGRLVTTKHPANLYIRILGPQDPYIGMCVQ